MSYTYYCVKTKRGYVARWDLSSPLTDDHPASAAYCYDDIDKAVKVAELFQGDLLRITRTGTGQKAPRVAEIYSDVGWIPYLD